MADDADPEPALDAGASGDSRTPREPDQTLHRRRAREATDQGPESTEVGFAEPQRLAAAEDFGNFAYHLDRLRGGSSPRRTRAPV
jgi:hypothetical protein